MVDDFHIIYPHNGTSYALLSRNILYREIIKLISLSRVPRESIPTSEKETICSTHGKLTTRSEQKFCIL